MASGVPSGSLTEADANFFSRIKSPPHWQTVSSHALLLLSVLSYHYRGSGTEDDPYQVGLIPGEHRDPMNFPQWKKWTVTLLVAFATLAVAFSSSAYTGGAEQITKLLHSSDEVVILGLSLLVLGVSKISQQLLGSIHVKIL